MRKSALALILFMSTGWACAQEPVALPCTEGDVGTDPPASVRFVGLNEFEVPFDSWGCPGRAVDAFIDPQNFQVLSADGTVNVFLVTSSANDISATGENAGGRAELDIEPIEPGHVRIAVPDPTLEWTIRLRVATPTDRVAYYEMVLAPPG